MLDLTQNMIYYIRGRNFRPDRKNLVQKNKYFYPKPQYFVVFYIDITQYMLYNKTRTTKFSKRKGE